MPRPLRIPAVPHYLAILREKLGLTQQQLASVLGVSRTLITKVETGSRVLPPTASLVVAWLVPTLSITGADSLEPGCALPADPAPLQARAEAVAYEILQLGRRLARGQARATRAARWLQAAPKLLAALPPEATRQRLWLAATTADAEAALEGEGSPSLHRLLAARLAGLRAEAAALAGELESPAG